MLQEVAGRIEDKGLKTVLPSGVGFHNASLSAADRSAVEQLFLQGDLPVLSHCSCRHSAVCLQQACRYVHRDSMKLVSVCASSR
jgi:hypothetical protein